ncbi:MAG: hypothetical protein HQL38_00835 [Alphaproteobacteria bacterium]|nr:hypothetical protein [Alphaproteobacteria bacterium]
MDTHTSASCHFRDHTGCEFCRELVDGRGTFARTYETEQFGRTLMESPSFVVWPSLGPLTVGHVLILPRFHIEAMASLQEPLICELEDLVAKVNAMIGGIGHVAAFEHGACAENGGACGIYHAHLHLLPLPSSVELGVVFAAEHGLVASLTAAYRTLRGASDYLLFQNGGGPVGHADMTKTPKRFPSQHFRRVLNDRFGFLPHWDWRVTAATVDDRVLATMNLFRCSELREAA